METDSNQVLAEYGKCRVPITLTKRNDKMEYKLKIFTNTKSNVFSFEKKRLARSYDEIIDYVNEMAKIYKKSSKLIVVIYDEDEKKIAMYNYDNDWFMF